MNKTIYILICLLSISIATVAQSNETKPEYERDYCVDFSNGDIDLTIEYFKEIIAADSADLKALYTLGMCYFVKQEADSSIIVFTKLIEKDYCYDYALINLALAKYYSGQKDEGCIDYKAAMNCGYKIDSNMKKEYKPLASPLFTIPFNTPFPYLL